MSNSFARGRIQLLLTSYTAMVLASAVTGSGAGALWAQTYPSKPIRFVAAEAGGGGDITARMIALGINRNLGQPVIVDNRGNASAEIVAHAPADGYTLLANGPIVWLTPFMRANVPWDPLRDFTIITFVAASPSVLVVHPSVAATSVAELIALAKAKPGALNFATAQPGSSSHIAGELFKMMTSVNIVRVPYKGNGPALNGLMSGEAQIMFAPPGSVAQQAKSGRLRTLAVTSPQPSDLVPGMPTVAAIVPGYQAQSMFGIFAPAKTPPAIINRLNQAIVQELSRPETRERLFSNGSMVVGSTPQKSAEMLRAEMKTLGKMIKDAGIREE